jgi:hypothetical protein
MNELLLRFARTKKIKMLTLTMGLHRSPEHQQFLYLEKDFQQFCQYHATLVNIGFLGKIVSNLEFTLYFMSFMII